MTNVAGGRKPQFQNDGVLHATINRHRFHLRTSAQGENLLWINGQQPPLLLDATAADFVRFLIEAMWLYQAENEGNPPKVIEHVTESMYKKYRRPFAIGRGRVTRDRIRGDFDRIYGLLMGVAEGKCPAEMGVGAKEINYASWNAPARMDLALTYRCNLRCGKCYLTDGGDAEELSTDQWLKVFEVLWSLGIPQVVFTGGEPTLRKDLVELVAHADEFVTGLVTNGTKLAELAEPLRDASLDYAQVTIESLDPLVHDAMTKAEGSHNCTVSGIRKALEVGLEVVTNTTLTRLNAVEFVETIKWLHHDLGLTYVACNTLICSGRGEGYQKESGLSEAEIEPILSEACRVAEDLGVTLQWYSPTCYSRLNPLPLNFGAKSCSAAAHNMTVQPDGSVLPCQSWPDAIGNILKDEWTDIWKHPVALALRNHAMHPTECGGREYLAQCGGGCPLDRSSRQASGCGGVQ